MTTRRARGRPLKPPVPGTRVSLGLKVTPTLKNLLVEASKASGRTQSQEAELRLELSFRDERLLTDIREMMQPVFALTTRK